MKRCTDEGRALMSLDLQVPFLVCQLTRICTLQHFLCILLPFLSLSIFKECCLYSFQVLINGLHHFVPIDVKPKLQLVETFIKVSIIMVSSLKLSCK